MIIEVLFWLCILAIFHSYLSYPFSLRVLLLFKKAKKFDSYNLNEELPTISILMAVYNEEQVIEQKIESIFKTSYPHAKIEVIIGSDNSTDQTNNIVKQLSEKYTSIKFEQFTERQGKVKIVNKLAERASGELYFITDANVLLDESTLYEVVRFFKDDRIGLVDTNMRNYGLSKSGISIQEKSYISREVMIKNLESSCFGSMIGPFGGAYAIRSQLYTIVPDNFLVDDFFICMNVLKSEKFAINNIDAKAYEDVSNELRIEIQRKIRIAIGNFQNLSYFKKLLWPPFSPIAYCYFSHKVLRWFGPFFLIGALLANIILAFESSFYFILLILQFTLIISPIIDQLLKKIHIHIVFLRFTTHFYSMNLSLMIGFFKSIKGVKTNVWKPTKRFQG